ncbi:helix-turn-helix transcriptional regulator [Fodinibius sp.]|uniref:helix-turn-helix domain-containing protein n=1 Tax=Fodinibius sp. TaxID=1872440 RepID=UPI002ACEC46E|nr:helix-turn-helix transcriptional regulator [Fodinibius sp.]MDZ7657893.1 helix-turn-helix transcriptional regulator [Fodinibius sp.]
MASLGRDLAHIRKEQELSLEEIYEATKIPTRILESIEDDSIFTDFENNATYIRSYVRSYAKALSIDEKQIIYALDKVQKNDYSGSLQSLFDEQPKRSFEFDEEDDDADEESADSDELQDKDMVHDHSPEFQSDQTDSSENSPETPRSSPLPKADHPDVKSVDWADMGRKFKPLKSVRSRTWAGIFVTLLIIIGTVSFFYFYETDPVSNEVANNPTTNQQTESSEEKVSTDSLELDIVPATETNDTTEQQPTATADDIPNEALSTLPDTLSIVLYAAYGRLEPVRVYTDIMNDINPYWIEQGEAIRFNFVNELNIRGQFSRMVLLLNGHPVQNLREEFYNPDSRLLEINRSYFENDPQWLQPAPDSLQIDAPPPSTIRDRPTFN